MKKSLIALAFGTLALGIAEFVMMGILPDIASDLHVSIAEAGHLISAYALGVCVGAPMLILARKHPLKRILLVLVAVIMAGNVCAALAPNFWTLMAARFVSGLPHGAYFGVGSITAEKLADKRKGSEAGPTSGLNKEKVLRSYQLLRTFALKLRSEADSNRCSSFCRAVPSHSAIRPFRECKYTIIFHTPKILQD